MEPGAAPPLDIKGVAEKYGVTVNAVRHWKKAGAPVLERRGRSNALLFDSLALDAWVAEHKKHLPGEQGQEGGAAREEQRREGSGPRVQGSGTEQDSATSGSPEGGEKPRPVPEPKAEDLGIEPALRRVEKIEYTLAVRIERLIRGEDEAAPLAVKAILNKYKDMVEELRQLAVGLVKVKEAEGALVPRVEMLENLCMLAGMIRGALDAFADEALPEIMADLARKKVEIGDMTKAQRVFREAMQKASDGWLERLSRLVREIGEASPTERGRDDGQ